METRPYWEIELLIYYASSIKKMESLFPHFHSFRWGIVCTPSALFAAINYNFLFANFIPLHHPQICPYLSEWSQEKDFSSDIDLGFFFDTSAWIFWSTECILCSLRLWNKGFTLVRAIFQRVFMYIFTISAKCTLWLFFVTFGWIDAQGTRRIFGPWQKQCETSTSVCCKCSWFCIWISLALNILEVISL